MEKKQGKKQLRNVLLFLLVLIISVGIARAEFYTYGTAKQKTFTNDTYYLYAWAHYDDEYVDFVGRGKTFDIAFRYSVNDLNVYNSAHPDNLVEWVNVTCMHTHNTWESGAIINYSDIITSEYWDNTTTPTGLRYIFAEMGNQDYLLCTADIKYVDETHYRNDFQGIMGGWRFRAPSFECSACSQYTYEELVRAEQKEGDIHTRAMTIYDYIGGFISMNYELWLIAFWIIRIAVVIAVIGLFISVVFWLYHTIKRVGTSP